MIVGVEDVVSEAVVRKILTLHKIDASVVLGLRGKGYLKSKAQGLNRTAQTQSVFLLTDQDSPSNCPASILASWIPGEISHRLLFRVAVYEVEAWLLAHRDAFAKFAGIAAGRIPPQVDEILDPKQVLVNLCRKSSNSRVRTGIVPPTGSTSGVGPDYNPLLTTFIADSWNPAQAATSSPSLARTLKRINVHVQQYIGA